MVFSSSVFMFMFLPLVWLLYTVIPDRYIKAKNAVLGIFSVIFYAFGEPVYIVLMLGSIVLNYFAAVFIGKASEKGKNIICTVAIAANLLVLGIYKYSPWIVRVINDACSTAFPVPEFTIPVGISFYTFQILSYVVDVKQGKAEIQKNIFNLLLYIAFFPQLIAGPIVRYIDIQSQIENRTVTAEKTANGIRRFISGIAKKILISNTAAVIADAAFAGEEISTLFAWAGAIAYCIQLYFDFSGYSDMAIGLASVFGFTICENFNYPYSAVSVRDFWKRWHISLTTWFREYVYFALGGNRKGKARTILNRLFVFFLTGLWHGANFTFVVWGLWHGFLMMFEQLVHFDKLTAIRPLRPLTRLYTLLTVCLGFVVFRAPDMTSAMQYISRMFSFTGSGADALVHFSPYTCLILIFGILLSFPVLPTLRKHLAVSGKTAAAFEIAGYVLALPILMLCIMQLASSTFNPFIYYNF
ncbi:MAG: MBOAT family protein [Ruminococcaceae bacterium]|nr:MBOAT family protein [Oscillospiraceae bacterium]